MHREKDKTILTRSREGREERDVDRLPNNLLASSLRVFAPSREKKVSTSPPINFLNDDRDAFWITPMIQNASGKRQNHLTRSREGREGRDLDRLPNHLLASSLRVFAPSREKRCPRTPPINFLNDDRDAFWITPMIQNAPRFILNHPDDPELVRDDPGRAPDDPVFPSP